jgi:fructose 1,6-bisphosphatase
MKFIDRGFFYKVFEYSESRVLKKRRSLLDILIYTKPKYLIQVFKQNNEAKKQTLIIKNKLSEIPGELFGNPFFVDKYNYTQDKVELLYHYFDKHI